MRITVDREACEAHGVCESLAPDVFELDDDELLHVVEEPPGRHVEEARRAVQSCPKMALSLESDG